MTMSDTKESGSGQWEFDVDDVIIHEDAPDVAPTHLRVKRRLTDEKGGRFYHFARRYPHTLGDADSEVYGDVLFSSEKIEGDYYHVGADRD